MQQSEANGYFFAGFIFPRPFDEVNTFSQIVQEEVTSLLSKQK